MVDVAELIGVPFVHGGRDPKVGLDCYGLVKQLYEPEHGVVLPDFRVAADANQILAMFAVQRSQWIETLPNPGAVVLFSVNTLYRAAHSHVGFVLPDRRFIHTWELSGGVTIESLRTWEHRIVGFYEYVGFHDVD